MKITCSKCDAFLESDRIYKQRYCKKCQSAYSQEKNRLLKDNPVVKHKQAARVKANNVQYRGLIQKQPCVVCGHENAEKHHEDYNKPLEFIWLCRPCHRKAHAQLQQDKVLNE